MSKILKQGSVARTRPTRGALERRVWIHASQTAWSILHGGARSKPYPPLSYSINRRDVTGAELGLLLAAASSEDMAAAAGPPLCRQNYSYWCSPQGLHHAAKLEVALRRSVATVACFTTWDVYDSDVPYSNAGSAAPGADAARPQSSSPSLLPPLRHPHHPHPADALGEEECPLTALQHQQERERAARSRRASAGASPYMSYTASSCTASSASPASSLASASGHASASSPSCSSPPPSPSSPSSASPTSPWPKPPTPPGVPNMDWNWLQPSSRGCSSSSSGSSSGSSSSSSSTSSPSSLAVASVPPSPSSSSSSSSSWASSPASPSSPSSHLFSNPFFPPRELAASSSSARGPSSRSRARKNLVGFARATGDNSLVATIYDVAVHPAVRGLGIGRRLVKLLTQQVQARAVYDIGVVTPTAAAGFWERCAFEDDREGSTFMTFVGRRGPDDLDWAPAAPQDLLESDCLGYWEAAQHSESLRGLLAGKLQQARAETGTAGQRGGRLGARGARPGIGAAAGGWGAGLCDTYGK